MIQCPTECLIGYVTPSQIRTYMPISASRLSCAIALIALAACCLTSLRSSGVRSDGLRSARRIARASSPSAGCEDLSWAVASGLCVAAKTGGRPGRKTVRVADGRGAHRRRHQSTASRR